MRGRSAVLEDQSTDLSIYLGSLFCVPLLFSLSLLDSHALDDQGKRGNFPRVPTFNYFLLIQFRLELRNNRF